MTIPSSPMLQWFRRHARLSNLARGLWLLVALLHVWLVARRMFDGEYTELAHWLRAVLCIAGVIYASLKFWQVATILDSGPRRAVAFGLIMIVGHWMINPTVLNPYEPGAAAVLNVTVVVAVLPAIAAALLVFAVALRMGAVTPRAIPLRLVRLSQNRNDDSHLPLNVARRATRLYRRPPPFLG